VGTNLLNGQTRYTGEHCNVYNRCGDLHECQWNGQSENEKITCM